jgi:hypothetical protein
VAATPLTVPAGARVELMVINEVSTKIAKPGDRFLLKLAQPLAVGDRIVIPRGTKAWGEVLDARANGIAGQSGKLATRLLHIDYNGLLLPIRGDMKRTGQNGNLQIVMATLALTPWGLVAKGNNAKLKAGDLIDGVLVDDFVPSAVPPPKPAAPAPPPPKRLPDDEY